MSDETPIFIKKSLIRDYLEYYNPKDDVITDAMINDFADYLEVDIEEWVKQNAKSYFRG